jgi:hypothetical protein
MTHFIKKCQYCDVVISQCKCFSCSKTETSGICHDCERVKNKAEKDARGFTYDNPYEDIWESSLYAYLYEIATEVVQE